MADLRDYSGPFDPSLKLTDFSKEALIRLIQACCKDYLGIDGSWTSLMREKLGDKATFAYANEVWGRWGVAAEVRRTREAFNIWGTNVEAVMKYIQFSASLGALYDLDVELKDKNHGEYSIRRCQSLEYFERHNDLALLKQGCENLCIPYNQLSGECFNPKVKWVPIKLPPRERPNEIACKWAITLEE
jgi:hypothetical protein